MLCPSSQSGTTVQEQWQAGLERSTLRQTQED